MRELTKAQQQLLTISTVQLVLTHDLGSESHVSEEELEYLHGECIRHFSDEASMNSTTEEDMTYTFRRLLEEYKHGDQVVKPKESFMKIMKKIKKLFS